MNTKGDCIRQGYYELKDFLDSCRMQKNKVQVSPKALDDANNLLHLANKNEVLAYIAQHKEEDFLFVNTEPFRKGVNGKHPLVDSYRIELRWYDLYIAFCFLKTSKGWYIKSFHSSNAETISIGEMLEKLR